MFKEDIVFLVVVILMIIMTLFPTGLGERVSEVTKGAKLNKA